MSLNTNEVIKIYPLQRCLHKFPWKKPKISSKRIKVNLELGPRFISNILLEKILFDELLSGKKTSLRSIQECLASKIDPNVKNKNDFNNRPLHYAAKYGNIALAELLICSGGQVNLANKLGETPLLLAARGENEKYTEFVSLMISNGAEVNNFDRGGISPLEWSIRASNFWTMYDLLSNGANIYNNEVSLPNKTKVEKLLQLAHEIAAKRKKIKSSETKTSKTSINAFISLLKLYENTAYQIHCTKYIIFSKMIVDTLEAIKNGNLVLISKAKRASIQKRVNTGCSIIVCLGVKQQYHSLMRLSIYSDHNNIE